MSIMIEQSDDWLVFDKSTVFLLFMGSIKAYVCVFSFFCFSPQRNLLLILQLVFSFVLSFKFSWSKCMHLYLKIAIFSCLKPMALEQVLSDRDSEDEVDDDVADFEDRRVCLIIAWQVSLFLCLFCICQFCLIQSYGWTLTPYNN